MILRTPYSLTIVLLFCLLLAASNIAYAGEASVIKAIQVDGSVLRNGKPLKEGETLQRDDQIVSQDNSAAVLRWSNGSIVKVYPRTKLVIKGVAFENDKKVEKTFLFLKNGRAFIKAQVPEHIFCQFEVSIDDVIIRTQGAEFALKYDSAKDTLAIWSLIGDVVILKDINKTIVREGQQARMKVDGNLGAPVAMSDKTKAALTRVSKKIGGSLLIEESGPPGGPLKVKIGGVRNRRGESPYKVKFKALISGGSGKIKSIKWKFGDGENAEGKSAQHTFTQGVYGVVVEVEDANGQKSSSQISISAEEDCAC